MAVNQTLADRVRGLARATPGVAEKGMFGGLAFLLNGRMFGGIVGHDFMVRVGAAQYGEALAQPHTRPMDFTGRPLQGFVFVGPGDQLTDEEIRRWVERAIAFAATLPPPHAPRSRRRTKTAKP